MSDPAEARRRKIAAMSLGELREKLEAGLLSDSNAKEARARLAKEDRDQASWDAGMAQQRERSERKAHRGDRFWLRLDVIGTFIIGAASLLATILLDR